MAPGSELMRLQVHDVAVPLVQVQGLVAVEFDGAFVHDLAHALQFAVALEVIDLQELEDVVFVDFHDLQIHRFEAHGFKGKWELSACAGQDVARADDAHLGFDFLKLDVKGFALLEFVAEDVLHAGRDGERVLADGAHRWEYLDIIALDGVAQFEFADADEAIEILCLADRVAE